MTLPPYQILAGPRAAGADAPKSTSAQRPERVKILPVVFVLVLGLEFPFYPLFQKTFPILSRFGWSSSTKVGAETIFAQATIAIVILLVVHFWERLPMSSIGIFGFDVSDLFLAVTAGVALILIEGYLPSFLMTAKALRGLGFAGMAARQFALIDRIPWPVMLAMALTAGIYEEIWARGYGVERLEALTHSTLAAAAITLALDLGAHVPFWGLRYAIVIAPGQMLLLGLYLWRRRLMPCVVAHVLWDSGRPVLLAMVWLSAMFPSMHAARGLAALGNGNYDQSIAEFNTALHADPNNLIALQGRSEAYSDLGKYDQAIDDLTTIIKLKPDNTQALGDRATAYWYKGNFDGSIADLSRVIKLKPTDEWAYSNRANSYYHKHDYPRAMADANESIKLAPNDSGTYSMRAYVDAATGDQKTEHQDLDHAIRLDPGDHGALSLRASFHSDHGEYDQAIADYSRVLENNPDDTQALGGRATAYWYKDNFDGSIADLTRVIKLKPTDEWAYSNRANSYYCEHDYPRAMADANESIKLAPKNSGTYSMRAYVDAATGDTAGAIKDLDRAIALAPDRLDLYQQRAAAYTKLGKLDPAIADWRRVLANPPKTAGEYNDQAWTLATNPLAAVRNGKQAVGLATEGCKLSGWKKAEYLDTLAAAYAEKGDFADAIVWEKKAIAALAPSDKNLAPEMRDRLALYQAGHPYRDSYPSLF